MEVSYNLEDIKKEIAKRRMTLGGHIVGLANKKENYNNNDVRMVASIDERGRKIIEKGTDEQKVVSEEVL